MEAVRPGVDARDYEDTTLLHTLARRPVHEEAAAFLFHMGRKGWGSMRTVVGAGEVRGFERVGELFVEEGGCSVAAEGYFVLVDHCDNSDHLGGRRIAWVIVRQCRLERIVVLFHCVGSNLLGIAIETFHLRCLDFSFGGRLCRAGD